MKAWKHLGLVAALVASTSLSAGLIGGIDILGRGDANNDGRVDISDVQTINGFLFNGGNAPPCMNQADVDDNGVLNVGDSAYLSNYLYQGGPAPPAPGPNNSACWTDMTTPNLSCNSTNCY